jgi:hypothetical protein
MIVPMKPRNNSVYKAIHRKRSRRTFPDCQNAPFSPFQQIRLERVPLTIAIKLCSPEFGSSFRQTEMPAPFVSMPEATMNENHGAEPGQNDVWPPRHARHM